jgi:hypothetical protein
MIMTIQRRREPKGVRALAKGVDAIYADGDVGVSPNITIRELS